MGNFMSGGFAAALNGATSLLGMAGQNQQYKRQLRMMREQNQFNRDERIAAQNWQKNMWNASNEYNTASAQRQRLEAAGLNPYLMMNGGSAGTAESAGASPMATASATPQSPNFMDAMNPLQQAFSQMAQLVQQDKQIESQIALNDSNVSLNSIRGLQLDSLKEWQNRQKQRIDDLLPFETELMTAQANAQRSQQRLNDANAQLAYTQDFGQVLKNNLSQKELEKFDANFIASTGLKYAQAIEAMASAGASEAMSRQYIALAVGTEFWNGINRANRKVIEDNFVEGVKAEGARKRLERSNDEAEYLTLNVPDNEGIPYKYKLAAQKVKYNYRQYGKDLKQLGLDEHVIDAYTKHPNDYRYMKIFGDVLDNLNPIKFMMPVKSK
nr:pilot protein for DNA ejection [uncultured phage]